MGRTDVVEYLVNNVLYKVEVGVAHFLFFKKTHCAAISRFLLSSGSVLLYFCGQTMSLALMEAFGKGDELNKIKILIKIGANLNFKEAETGDAPLHKLIAAYGGLCCICC